jgi:hypothetical protein
MSKVCLHNSFVNEHCLHNSFVNEHCLHNSFVNEQGLFTKKSSLHNYDGHANSSDYNLCETVAIMTGNQ